MGSLCTARSMTPRSLWVTWPQHLLVSSNWFLPPEKVSLEPFGQGVVFVVWLFGVGFGVCLKGGPTDNNFLRFFCREVPMLRQHYCLTRLQQTGRAPETITFDLQSNPNDHPKPISYDVSFGSFCSQPTRASYRTGGGIRETNHKTCQAGECLKSIRGVFVPKKI